jgi:hypothetical protein
VTGNRVTIDGLGTIGGFAGIAGRGAGSLTIRNCAANGAGTGIAFVRGSGGTVDGCLVQQNTAAGVRVEGASVLITNSTITSNPGFGIIVASGGSARVGVPRAPTGPYEPNTISDNGASGILVAEASALIGGNTISRNAGGGFGAGVWVRNGAQAVLPGGNAITDNRGTGVLVQLGAVAFIGDSTSPINTITQNGLGGPAGGVFVLYKSTAAINRARIDNNIGSGITVQTRSFANLSGGTVSGNSEAGIVLHVGAAITLWDQPVTAVGNGGFDLQCLDVESSFIGNTAGFGSVDPNCTGF